jgi:putative PIN family toxin of toxin-antitoxin system
MEVIEAVLDTNVIYSGLRSRLGAAHRLLQELGVSTAFRNHLSVPLLLEYEEVLRRNSRALGLTHLDIDDFLDYVCSVAGLHKVFYLWRPFLSDPDDDMLLELAVEANCSRIVTYNVKDFSGTDKFGVTGDIVNSCG